jgi:hypothetical protein
MRSAKLLPIFSIAATPLLLAALGVTHPRVLTPETASYWHTLHLILLVLFPLLGINLWWLLSGFSGSMVWAARALGLVYIVFYGALDVLAGIGTGLVVMRVPEANTPELSETVRWLFAQGNELALVGVWAFLIACVLTSTVLIQKVGRFALPGAVLLCGAAYPFLGSHIYWPVGVASMVLMAGGFAFLMWAKLRWARLPSERTVAPVAGV